jgi:hypothetical protein
LPELTSDHLAKAIKNGTSPAWLACPRCELLHRRIKNRLHDNGKLVSETADLLINSMPGCVTRRL